MGPFGLQGGGGMDKFVALRFILGQNKAHIYGGV